MPRTERELPRYVGAGCVLAEVTETFVVRCPSPEGGVMRGDGEGLWFDRGYSWYGKPPVGWRAELATEEHFERKYEIEYDYS